MFTSAGLYATCLPRRSPEEAIAAVKGEDLEVVSDRALENVLENVFAIFQGQPIDLSGVRLDFSDLTPRQRAVLKAAMGIPRGSTVTYGELAKMAGLPGAARFVGNVMASNRFAPIIPCHRVVSAGGIGGYALGRRAKATLLSREGVSLYVTDGP